MLDGEEVGKDEVQREIGVAQQAVIVHLAAADQDLADKLEAENWGLPTI